MFFGMDRLGLSPAEAFSAGLALQGGTTLAAIYVFRREVANLLRAIPYLLSKDGDVWTLRLSILVAMTAITGAMGLPLLLMAKAIVASWSAKGAILLTGIALLLTAAVMRLRERPAQSGRSPTIGDGVLAGLVQGLSVLPGVSRSGATLACFSLRGLGSEESFRLAFLAGIPATLGSSLIEAALDRELLGLMGMNLVISAVASLITGLLVMRVLLSASRKVNMGALCAILGAFAVLWSLIVP